MEAIAEEILAVEPLSKEPGAVEELVAAVGAELVARRGEPRRRVREPHPGPHPEGIELQPVHRPTQLRPRRLPGHARAVAARQLAQHRHSRRHVQRPVGAHDRPLPLRIVLARRAPAQLQPRQRPHLPLHPVDPEALPARLALVAHPDRDRIQVLVHARHRAPEQQPPAERLHRVVQVALLQPPLDDHRRPVAVARHDLHPLAVDQPVAAAQRVRPRHPQPRQLVHHLPRRAAAAKRLHRPARPLHMRHPAGQGAVQCSQHPQRVAARAAEVPVAHVAAPALQLAVAPAARLGEELRQRRVPVDRIELLRPNVPHQPLPRIVLRVVVQRQAIVVPHRARQEQRPARAGAQPPRVAAGRQVRERVLEPVAPREDRVRAPAPPLQPPLHQPQRQQGRPRHPRAVRLLRHRCHRNRPGGSRAAHAVPGATRQARERQAARAAGVGPRLQQPAIRRRQGPRRAPPHHRRRPQRRVHRHRLAHLALGAAPHRLRLQRRRLPQREVRPVQLARLQIHELAEPVARVPVRQRHRSHPLGQRAAVHPHHVQPRAHPDQVVLAFHVGDRRRPVLHHHPHPRHSQLLRSLQAVRAAITVEEHLAGDGAFVGEHPAAHPHPRRRGVGHRVERGGRGARPVDAVAERGARTDLDPVGERAGRAAGQGADAEAQVRSRGAARVADRGAAKARAPAHVGEPRRQHVADHQVGHRRNALVVNGHCVVHQVGELYLVARSRLLGHQHGRGCH